MARGAAAANPRKGRISPGKRPGEHLQLKCIWCVSDCRPPWLVPQMLVDIAYLRALLGRFTAGQGGRAVLGLLAELERAAAERSIDKAAIEPTKASAARWSQPPLTWSASGSTTLCSWPRSSPRRG